MKRFILIILLLLTNTFAQAESYMQKVYLNEEIGEDIPQGKSHYLIMFKKN